MSEKFEPIIYSTPPTDWMAKYEASMDARDRIRDRVRQRAG